MDQDTWQPFRSLEDCRRRRYREADHEEEGEVIRMWRSSIKKLSGTRWRDCSDATIFNFHNKGEYRSWERRKTRNARRIRLTEHTNLRQRTFKISRTFLTLTSMQSLKRRSTSLSINTALRRTTSHRTKWFAVASTKCLNLRTR